MLFDHSVFAGKRFIITGGGSGLGQSLATFLINHGANVVLLGRSIARLNDMKTQFGDAVEVHPCNIKDYQQVNHVVQACCKKPVDGLINNAAANFPLPTEQLSQNAFHAIFDTVAQGTFYMTQAMGKHWLKHKKKGVIVSLSTTYASGAGPFVVPSAMGKAAVEAMTRSLAVEWGNRDIRLLAVSPGLIHTDGAWKHLFAAVADEQAMDTYIPSGQAGTQDALNQLIGLMLSDGCPYLTGTVVPLDGAFALTSGAGPFYHWFKSLTPEQWDKVKRLGKQADNEHD